MKRRLARVKAVQALFQVEMSGTDKDEAINNVLDENEENDTFLNILVTGTLEYLKDIDEIFTNHLLNWKLERVSNVDRTVIRIAIYEMKYVTEIPINVSLNEAIDIAKGFGGDESGRFVNGVLSKVADTLKIEE